MNKPSSYLPTYELFYNKSDLLFDILEPDWLFGSVLTKRIKLDEGSPVYHCIGRIVGGAMVLGQEEKERFRRLMWRVAEFSGVEIITYCVMSNHVHLLVRVPKCVDLSDDEICERLVRYYGKREPWVQVLIDGVKRDGALSASVRQRLLARMGDVSMFMRTLKQRFSRWYNRRHKRFGTLWAERFKSVLVQDQSEALRTVAMYIDLNPVRAGLVKDPKEYRYCGHAEAVAGNRSIRAEVIAICEGKGWRAASGEYRQTMMVYAGEPRDPNQASLNRDQVLKTLEVGGAVSTAEILRLRLRYFSDGLVFGTREFVEDVFREFRDRFGERRKIGAHKPRGVGGSLDAFATVRDLRKSVVE